MTGAVIVCTVSYYNTTVSPNRSSRCTAMPTHGSRKPANAPPSLLAWLRGARSQSQAGTGKIIFRLLFAETDVKRRYGLKEYTLTPLLSSVLGVDFKSTSQSRPRCLRRSDKNPCHHYSPRYFLIQGGRATKRIGSAVHLERQMHQEVQK